jgi:predicted enzyme related to lactoylglutathione lyase
MSIPTGRFVWFEYVSKDAKKAQGLFGELFGWSTKSVPMPDGNYTMIAAPDGTTIGGYGASPEGDKQAVWLPYLQVQNVADITEKVKKLGGSVFKPPFKVGDIATMSVLSDPLGAGIALWQPNKPAEPPKPTAGHFCWNELASKDPAASVKFYTQIGDFTTKGMDMGTGGTYHLLESGGQSRAGIMAQQMPNQAHTWLPYVQVASADQTADKAKRLGATVVVPPTDIPTVGRFAIFADAQGAATGILQP